MKKSLTAEEKVKALREVERTEILDRRKFEEQSDQSYIGNKSIHLGSGKRRVEIALNSIAYIVVDDKKVTIVGFQSEVILIYSISLTEIKKQIESSNLKSEFFFHKSFILAYAFLEKPGIKYSLKYIISELRKHGIPIANRVVKLLRSELNRRQKLETEQY